MLPRPTIDDVAAAAGVSRATVSRALRGGHRVSSRAMTAIQQAVARTGYVVNRNARNLASHRAQSVAFVLCEPPQRLVADPSFNLLLSTCAQELTAHDLILTVAVTTGPDLRSWVRRHLLGGQVDGALVVSAHASNPIADELHGAGVPVVVYGTPFPATDPAPGADDIPAPVYVAADDRSGATEAVRHLLGRGRRTIATIAGPPETACGLNRLAGWRDAVGETADDRLIAVGDYTAAGGQAAMAELLHRAPELDAVFVAGELMAAGAIAALSRAGRRVPDDVAVAGFDDSAVAATIWPSLTTVRRPLAEISHRMVELVLELIDGGSPRSLTLPTELVIREST